MPLEHQLAQVLVTTPDIPHDRLIFEERDEKGQLRPIPMTEMKYNKKKKRDELVQRGPTFTTKQVAEIFFGMSNYWVRWRERMGDTFLDGLKVEPERTAANARRFNLADVERLSHALRANDAITTEVHIKALRALLAIGHVHGII